LHGLSQHFTAQLLGVSEATMSSWMNGKSTPSLAKAIDIGDLFTITPDRLMGAEFVELLQRELADPERFEKVETRIKRGRSKLTSVVSDGDNEESWGDWVPKLEDADSERFKWDGAPPRVSRVGSEWFRRSISVACGTAQQSVGERAELERRRTSRRG
jgi:transcriptional regulator with XRE-family HTH domain